METDSAFILGRLQSDIRGFEILENQGIFLEKTLLEGDSGSFLHEKCFRLFQESGFDIDGNPFKMLLLLKNQSIVCELFIFLERDPERRVCANGIGHHFTASVLHLIGDGQGGVFQGIDDPE